MNRVRNPNNYYVIVYSCVNGAKETKLEGVAREEELFKIDKEVLTEVSHAFLVP